jgi:hypothetical protein
MEIERIDSPALDQLQAGDAVHVKPVTIVRIEGDHVWCKLFSGQEVPVEASHIEFVTREAAPVPAPSAATGDTVTWDDISVECEVGEVRGRWMTTWVTRSADRLTLELINLDNLPAGFRIVRRATCCRSCALDKYAKERPPVEDQISAWMTEQDRLTLAVLTKLAEECNELAGRAVRCIAQGIDEDDPKSGRANREELNREIADVAACIEVAQQFFMLSALHDRADKKLAGYRRWHEMIKAEPHEAK